MKVLEFGAGIAVAYAGYLLRDMGWDIDRIILDDEDPLISIPSRWGDRNNGLELFLNRDKSVSFDTTNGLQERVADVDIVIGDFSRRALTEWGIQADFFEVITPRVGVISVTSFGLSHHLSEISHSELILQAASGLLYLTGEAQQAPQQLPPYSAEMCGGLTASTAAMALARAYRLDGELRRLDLSIVEAMSMHTFTQSAAFVWRGEVTRREASVKEGLRVVPTSDGYVYCAPGATASMDMKGIAKLIDEPRLTEERFQTAEGRKDNYDEFLALFIPPFREKTAEEWFTAADELHLTFSLVRTVDELFSCEQLETRDIWTEFDSGAKIPTRAFSAYPMFG